MQSVARARVEQARQVETFSVAYARYECHYPALQRNAGALLNQSIEVTPCDVDLGASEPRTGVKPLAHHSSNASCGTSRIVYAHTSPRGIGNQFQWANSFLLRYNRSRLLLPVFELTTGKVVPFSFVFNDSILRARAKQHGLCLLEPTEAWQLLGATAATALYSITKLPTHARSARIVRVEAFKENVRRDLHSISPWLVDAPFSQHFRSAVRPTLSFLSHGGYVGVHYRVETAATSDRELNVASSQREKIFQSVGENAHAIANALRDAASSASTPPKQIYVASYLPSGPSPALDLLANLTAGFTLFRKFDFFPHDLEDRPHMHRNTLAILEWIILESATLFVGHCRSSMSRQINERRKLRGLPSILLFCPVHNPRSSKFRIMRNSNAPLLPNKNGEGLSDRIRWRCGTSGVPHYEPSPVEAAFTKTVAKHDPRGCEAWNPNYSTLEVNNKTAVPVLGTPMAQAIRAFSRQLRQPPKQMASRIWKCGMERGGLCRMCTPSFMEPLVSFLRSPRALSSPEYSGQPDIMTKDWLLLPSAQELQMVKDRGGRIMYIDLGAGQFSGGSGDPGGDGNGSLAWFSARLTQPIDEILAWEARIINPTQLWRGVPKHLVPRMRYFNVPVEWHPEAKFNPWRVLHELGIRTHDYVVVKLDVDNRFTELELIYQLIQMTERGNGLVDELFWEHHVAGSAMCCPKLWGSKKQQGWSKMRFNISNMDETLKGSYALFSRMRQLGIRAHSWV